MVRFRPLSVGILITFLAIKYFEHCKWKIKVSWHKIKCLKVFWRFVESFICLKASSEQLHLQTYLECLCCKIQIRKLRYDLSVQKYQNYCRISWVKLGQWHSNLLNGGWVPHSAKVTLYMQMHTYVQCGNFCACSHLGLERRSRLLTKDQFVQLFKGQKGVLQIPLLI